MATEKKQMNIRAKDRTKARLKKLAKNWKLPITGVVEELVDRQFDGPTITSKGD